MVLAATLLGSDAVDERASRRLGGDMRCQKKEQVHELATWDCMLAPGSGGWRADRALSRRYCNR